MRSLDGQENGEKEPKQTEHGGRKIELSAQRKNVFCLLRVKQTIIRQGREQDGSTIQERRR